MTAQLTSYDHPDGSVAGSNVFDDSAFQSHPGFEGFRDQMEGEIPDMRQSNGFSFAYGGIAGANQQSR